jgi:hypothetical protein
MCIYVTKRLKANGWTVGWTVVKKIGTGLSWKPDGMVMEAGRDGHGSRTRWSRKPDGMVTEAGRDGHGSRTGWSRYGHGEWSKTKDLL